MSATSRLKRKLGDLGVDVSSSKANESFCFIGTPLPPLEKSRDTGEFVPLWKQEVRDEQGRRRLHGAFTGGFSAGYFNSVGSKEGWTPSTFVSSRSDRAKQKAARPEDFMDDEDLQDIRDSKKLVDKADEMDLTGTTQPAVEDADQSSLARALEAAMLPDAADSTGARILKKMGWKLGQGIGPRVTLRQRRLQEQLAKGLYATLDDIKIGPAEEEADKHLYPPLDIPVLNVPRKSNSHGVGYHPGLGLNATLGVSERSKNNSGPKISAGFGLGALNDADDDDVDIYDRSIEGMRMRTAYDGGDDDEHQHASKPKTTSGSRPLSGGTTFLNGTRVLAGFTLSDKPVAEDRWFPLPDVPPGWTPDPRRVWKQDVSQEDEGKENITASSSTAHRRFDITADERGKLLGEAPLPAAPRSVFEFISQKDKERLKRVASEIASGTPGALPTNLSARRTEPHIAQAALKGFQPFTSDPVKQARYTIYLQSQAAMDGSASNLTPALGQRTDEFHKEMEDYAKAALIFKPISGAMAGRFTSAAVIEQGPKVHEGLHKPVDEDIEMKDAEQKKAEEKVSPKVHAARMEMYGALTREVKPWQPARLLCKRFGVKDPDPPAPDSTDTLVGNKSRFTSGSEPSTSAAAAAGDQDDSEPQERKKGGPRDLANVGLGEDDTQGQDTLTYQRPAMDVFKAIFASDDEDSDGEDAKEDNEEGPSEPPTLSVPAPNKEKDTEMEELPSLVPFANTRNDSGAKLDLTSFKPTFIPREGKSKESNGKVKDKEKQEKGNEKQSGNEEKKSKKKREKKTAIVSFAMDEDGEDVPMKEEPRTHKKRRKAKNKGVEEEQKPPDDDDMWVEKPAPDIVKDLPRVSMVVDGEEDQNRPEKAAGPPKGRKRAIDFM
ncbi:hypothetical protein BDN72DRAFT_837646 [Pluteus cervinus]|uniref:Uncharacterized protein n=1 Tax=Pluteus cervinus TaxID=181527 RepID=A0ACD3B0Q2_9AGAR|nr:hypothetical protein BDN72DRAFT_837646 [Pluteus cervinus]